MEHRDTPDRELWRRAVEGEPACFGVLFDRYAAQVHAFCRARLYAEDPDAAADLVSVVFLETWRRRHSVVIEQDSVLPWLLGVARKVLLARGRSVRRHRRAMVRLAATGAASLTIPDPADAVAGLVDDERRLAAVREAFHTLRDDDRDVLLLCVWGGLDYESAAVSLGVPVGTVRSRLSRARRRLAALADENQQGVGRAAFAIEEPS